MEPNCFSNSSSTLTISSSGTGLPSLNSSGRRISNRRNSVLIGGRSLDGELDSLVRQMRQRFFRDHHLAVGPTFEGKSATEIAQSAAFGSVVSEGDDDHVCMVIANRFHNKR